MLNIKARYRYRTLARALAALALLVGSHSAVASNNPFSDTPEGFGAATTGGAGGEVVTVYTKEDLAYQLCRTTAEGRCSDETRRIIKFSGTFDFTGSYLVRNATTGAMEATGVGPGCKPAVTACSAPRLTESLLLLSAADGHCGTHEKVAVKYDYAGNRPLLVGSNKTLLGVGGAAGIKGKGLRLYRQKNIIIRNLTISDINQGIVFAGDALTISDVDGVWIDHNRFQNIGRQMIAGGFADTTNITISWNQFEGTNTYSSYCNGQHYWNVLLAGTVQTITISNNLFHNVAGRAPHIEPMRGVPDVKIHVVNNYWLNDEDSDPSGRPSGFFHALDATGANINVLAEGNYFSRIDSPITNSTGNIFASLSTPPVAAQNQCKDTLQRNCYGNMARPAPIVNHFVQDSAVMAAFKTAKACKASVVIPYTAAYVPTFVTAGAGPGKI